MKHRAFLLFTFCFLLAFAACQKQVETISPEELARRDSLALHVAVMPVLDCLPIYYAQQCGMFESEGLDVRLHEYLSQMDCDTALQFSHAQVAYTDIMRLLQMSDNTSAIVTLQGKMSLLTARTKRIRQLKHLGERLVALDRLSATDYWSDQLMEEAGLDINDIYRPQINDIQLRTTMLTEQLVDAALLPEPYATQAEMQGNRRLRSRLEGDSLPHFTCLAIQRPVLDDTMRHRQIKQFLAAVAKAAGQMNSAECQEDSIRNILKIQYALPGSVADSLKFTRFPAPLEAKAKDIDEAVRWLTKRERAPKKQRRDSLLCNPMEP